MLTVCGELCRERKGSTINRVLIHALHAVSSSWKLNWGRYRIPSFPLSIFYYCQPMMLPHLGFNLPVMRWKTVVLHFPLQTLGAIRQLRPSRTCTRALLHACTSNWWWLPPSPLWCAATRGALHFLSRLSHAWGAARRNFGGPTTDKH